MRVIIGGYKQGVETMERHLHHHRNLFTRIEVISQESPNPISYGIHCGGDGHIGAECLKRIFLTLEMASTGYPWDEVCLMDYDAIALKPLPCEPDTIYANGVWLDAKWGAYTFGHCPYTARPQTWARLLDQIRGYDGIRELDYGDRLFGRAAEDAGIAWKQIPGAVTGQNTIEMADVPRVREAIQNGCPCIHGIKSKEVYDAVFA